MRPPRATPPNALTPAEREQVLAVLHAPQHCDLAVAQVWARELDEGRFYCSVSSMYRILRAGGEVRERRSQATHPAKVKPELVATKANMVWSWDIKCRRRHLMSATHSRFGAAGLEFRSTRSGCRGCFGSPIDVTCLRL